MTSCHQTRKKQHPATATGDGDDRNQEVGVCGRSTTSVTTAKQVSAFTQREEAASINLAPPPSSGVVVIQWAARSSSSSSTCAPPSSHLVDTLAGTCHQRTKQPAAVSQSWVPPLSLEVPVGGGGWWVVVTLRNFFMTKSLADASAGLPSLALHSSSLDLVGRGLGRRCTT